jgi:hypothetical protein
MRAENRVNLRLTDKQLKKLDRLRGENTRSGYLRDLAGLGKGTKTSHLVLADDGSVEAAFKIKRYALETGKKVITIHYHD